jgi:hypothetical protein
MGRPIDGYILGEGRAAESSGDNCDGAECFEGHGVFRFLSVKILPD